MSLVLSSMFWLCTHVGILKNPWNRYVLALLIHIIPAWRFVYSKLICYIKLTVVFLTWPGVVHTSINRYGWTALVVMSPLQSWVPRRNLGCCVYDRHRLNPWAHAGIKTCESDNTLIGEHSYPISLPCLALSLLIHVDNQLYVHHLFTSFHCLVWPCPS